VEKKKKGWGPGGVKRGTMDNETARHAEGVLGPQNIKRKTQRGTEAQKKGKGGVANWEELRHPRNDQNGCVGTRGARGKGKKECGFNPNRVSEKKKKKNGYASGNPIQKKKKKKKKKTHVTKEVPRTGANAGGGRGDGHRGSETHWIYGLERYPPSRREKKNAVQQTPKTTVKTTDQVD